VATATSRVDQKPAAGDHAAHVEEEILPSKISAIGCTSSTRLR